MKKELACVWRLAASDERSQSSRVLHICRRACGKLGSGDQPVPAQTVGASRDDLRIARAPGTGWATSGVATVSGFAGVEADALPRGFTERWAHSEPNESVYCLDDTQLLSACLHASESGGRSRPEAVRGMPDVPIAPPATGLPGGVGPTGAAWGGLSA
jgi:hypothetical protein